MLKCQACNQKIKLNESIMRFLCNYNYELLDQHENGGYSYTHNLKCPQCGSKVWIEIKADYCPKKKKV